MAGSASPTPTLADQVRRLARGYVRHGAKANRRQQLGRSCSCDVCAGYDLWGSGGLERCHTAP